MIDEVIAETELLQAKVESLPMDGIPPDLVESMLKGIQAQCARLAQEN